MTAQSICGFPWISSVTCSAVLSPAGLSFFICNWGQTLSRDCFEAHTGTCVSLACGVCPVWAQIHTKGWSRGVLPGTFCPNTETVLLLGTAYGRNR